MITSTPTDPTPQEQFVCCPKCRKKLFRVLSVGGQIEIKCQNCKTIIRWPSLVGEIVVQSA